MYKRLLPALLALSFVPHAFAQELWSVPLGAKPAQAPMVAEIGAFFAAHADSPSVGDVKLTKTPGPSVVVLLENGGVRTFESDGSVLWTAELGPVPPRVQCALIKGGIETPPAFACPLANGSVAVLDGETGKPTWNAAVGLSANAAWAVGAQIEWESAGVLAADVTGKVVALDGNNGSRIWEYLPTKLSEISGPPSVYDIDGDGVAEVFLAGKEGVLSLDAQGKERFFAALDAPATSGTVVTDYDDDSHFEIYVVAGGKLFALDAEKGEPIWSVKLEAEDAASQQIAVADLDQDEKAEIIVAGKRLTAVSGDGKILFSHDNAGTGVAIGDVNTDADLEVVTTRAGALEILDAGFGPLLQTPLASPAQTSPVLATVGGASAIVITQDNALRVVRLGSRLLPQLAPWAAPRRDASGNATVGSPVTQQDCCPETAKLATNTASLGFATGFEDPAQITQWKAQPEGATVVRDEQTKTAGAASLKVTPGPAEARVASPAVEASPGLRRVNASMLVKGEGAHAYLAWDRVTGEPVLQEMKPADTTPEGWRRLRISGAVKPAGAKRVRIVLACKPGGDTWWDEVQATAQTVAVASVEVFWNQVGYEVHAPKHFTAAATFQAQQGTFRVIGEDGREVLAGNLGAPARITGAHSTDWGKFYCRGEFTGVDTPGKYHIVVELDGNTAQTANFEIGVDLYWERLFAPLVEGVTASRCTPEAVAAGGACKEAGCAWDERTENGCALNVGHLRVLNEVDSMLAWRLNDPKLKGKPSLGAEVAWGADHLVALADAAPKEGSETGPALSAALAGAARLFPKDTKYADAARKIYMVEVARAKDPHSRDLFCAALDLYLAKRDSALMADAKRFFPGPELDIAEQAVRYELEVDDTSMASFDVGRKLSDKSDALIKQADNPFGVVTHLDNGATSYFVESAGNTAFVLDAARDVVRCYRFLPKPEYLQFVMDQFDWVLGNNPFGVCFVEGVGVKPLPSYARADKRFPRGVPAGAVANGVRGEAAGVDRPALDLSGAAEPNAASNACPLGNTIAFLDAVANLKRNRMSAAVK